MNELANKESGGIVSYNPAENAMNIHASEAAERAATRAKNPEALAEAIDRKLEAQRDFSKGYFVIYGQGSRSDTSDSAVRSSTYCEQFGFNERTVRRWVEKLADPVKFDAWRKLQHEKVNRMIEMYSESSGSSHVSNSDNHWYTPSEYIESARAAMWLINLDPASSDLAQKVVNADVYFTIADDGLEQEWAGTVWLNPPYSMPEMEMFIDKLLSSHAVTEWVVLTNNSSDTGWYHKLLSACDSICIPKGRIGFINKDGDTLATRQGQTFFYKGKNNDRFLNEFNQYGVVLDVNS